MTAPRARSRLRPQRAEDALQIACTTLLDRFVPLPEQGGPERTAHEPQPNKGKAQAGKAKAMGLRPGWPDMIFAWRGTFAVEMKAPGVGGTSEGRGYATAGQRALHERLRAQGWRVYVCRSVEEFIAILRTEDVPCRARVNSSGAVYGASVDGGSTP